MKENNAGQELHEVSGRIGGNGGGGSWGAGGATRAGGTPLPPPFPKNGAREPTLVELANSIKKTLGFDQSLAVKDLIDAVSQECLSPSQMDELMRIDKIPDKLQYIAITLGIETATK